MDEQNQLADRFKELISNAEQMRGKEFRLALEELVDEGEEELEFLFVQYISDHNLNAETRMSLIRMAGHLQRMSFLVPLKKIIETEQHARVQQEAIIAVAKFNDRRALNILSQALQRITNPLLLSTLNSEISRIKENNPILALIPRFQAGQKSPKTFKITLQLLKRILIPADATIFTKFLASPDPLIQNGAFEILCIAGDSFHDAEIIEFYEQHFNQIPCIKEKECEELYLLTYHFKIYLSRYQFLIEEQIPNLQQQFSKVTDIRVKQLLLSLICKSKNQDVLSFLKNVYNSVSDTRSTIIEELSGNDVAVEFLFELYRTEKELKEKLIQSLLNIKQGLDYFVQQFFSLSFEEQELIARNLPYAGQYELADFIKKIFQSNIYRLKEILLTKLKETYEFSVEDILFDPTYEREFYFMGDRYLDAITRLFPVTAVKKLLEKIANPELSINKARIFLLKISELMTSELVFNFRDKEFLAKLFTRVIKSFNIELNMDFLVMLKSIKTFDKATFQNINSLLGEYVAERELQITPKERGELNRIKRNLIELTHELKKLDEGAAMLLQAFRMESLDFKTLTHLLKWFPMTVVTQKDQFFNYLTREFLKCHSGNVGEWTEFFNQFPRLPGIIKPVVMRKLKTQEDLSYKPLEELVEPLSGSPIRIVMNFKNRHLTAVLREEFREVDPGVPVVSYVYDLTDMDVLLCDTEMFRDIILQGKTLPDKIFLFMETLDGYSDFKPYNARNFVKPYLFYRIIKEVLQEIYI